MKLYIKMIHDFGKVGQFYGLFTESGEELYTHTCSNKSFAPGDLILNRPERIEELKDRFGTIELDGVKL